MEALQERIRFLESQLQQYRSEASPLRAAPDGQIPDSDADNITSALSAEERLPVEELTDRLGRLNVGEDGHMRYFGPRSNFSFLRSRLLENWSVSTVELQGRATNALKQLRLQVQVSAELRDHLLDHYWLWQNSWQYLVVKELFLRDLHADGTGEYASPLLLSAMLALAARYSDRIELRTDPADSSTAGNALAEQAKMLLYFESEAPTITTVQAAALLSLRETAIDKEALGWVYCGKCVAVLARRSLVTHSSDPVCPALSIPPPTYNIG